MMMLSGENFGRSHQASLTAIVQSQQHGQQGYQSFTATHIALHQSVHLMSAEGILPDLPYHLFLRTGQFERQMFLVECIEQGSHLSKNNSLKTRFTLQLAADQM